MQYMAPCTMGLKNRCFYRSLAFVLPPVEAAQSYVMCPCTLGRLEAYFKRRV